jgi:DNA-binding MarR family transcriptional regulator
MWAMREDPASGAWQAMWVLAHNPETMDRLRQGAEALGLTMAVGKALLRLDPDEPMSMRKLACALRCDNSYVTSVADALEERGLAYRQPHPSDRRVKVLVLSPAGKKARRRLEQIRDVPPAAFSALTEKETQKLAALLAKVQDRAAVGEPGPRDPSLPRTG